MEQETKKYPREIAFDELRNSINESKANNEEKIRIFESLLNYINEVHKEFINI
jgi:hypothetical protein